MTRPTRRRTPRWVRRRLDTMPHRPARQGRSEAGTITVFTALTAVALLLLAGLVVDGGGRLRAVGRADRIAAEAARAAVEAVNTRGRTLVLDRSAALAAATAYLHTAGATGTVTITGSRTIHVTAVLTGHYLILSLTGTTSYQVTGTATATLTLGVTTDP
jgi:hypothetical protein